MLSKVTVVKEIRFALKKNEPFQLSFKGIVIIQICIFAPLGLQKGKGVKE